MGGPGGPGGGGLRMGGGGGPMMAMMGGGGGQGRWNIALYHTVRLGERVLIAPGGPQLDLLAGDALSGGGVSRHALEFEGGLFHKGKGLRFNGSWTAPTHLRGSGLPGSSDLRFGSVFNVDLRAFIDLGQVSKAAFLKGFRVALTADNLFDSRQKVTDGSGATPLSYQRDYMDPRGRVLGIDLRKAF
jgi:iron complex outermembrane recepter protein